MKIGLFGWFSLEKGCATSGDILCLNTVVDWIEEWELEHEIVYAEKIGGKGFKGYSQNSFTKQIFISGPVDEGFNLHRELFGWFKGDWHFWSNSIIVDSKRFTIKNSLSRDGAFHNLPDFSLVAKKQHRPFIIKILRGKQIDYGIENCLDEKVSKLLNTVLVSDKYLVHSLSTDLDGEFQTMTDQSLALERLISNADLVITTRLHGLIHSIRTNTRVIAIDQIKGGAKVENFCRQIDWPHFVNAQHVDEKWCKDQIAACLNMDNDQIYEITKERAINMVMKAKDEAKQQIS